MPAFEELKQAVRDLTGQLRDVHETVVHLREAAKLGGLTVAEAREAAKAAGHPASAAISLEESYDALGDAMLQSLDDCVTYCGGVRAALTRYGVLDRYLTGVDAPLAYVNAMRAAVPGKGEDKATGLARLRHEITVTNSAVITTFRAMRELFTPLDNDVHNAKSDLARVCRDADRVADGAAQPKALKRKTIEVSESEEDSEEQGELLDSGDDDSDEDSDELDDSSFSDGSGEEPELEGDFARFYDTIAAPVASAEEAALSALRRAVLEVQVCYEAIRAAVRPEAPLALPPPPSPPREITPGSQDAPARSQTTSIGDLD